MKVVGIDLSGPTNIADTCMVVLNRYGEELNLVKAIHGAADQNIFQVISNFGKGESIVIGIDAPLSYNPGGGDRPSDSELRRLVLTKGRGVGVMTPTMIRMVYLTMRGIALTRTLETLKPSLDLRMLEVHPGVCMLLRDAPLKDVTGFKRNRSARLHLLAWLEKRGLREITRDQRVTDHYVAACAAAMGAWKWSLGQSAWLYTAEPPIHPYDFAC